MELNVSPASDGYSQAILVRWRRCTHRRTKPSSCTILPNNPRAIFPNTN
jgi:hypothetical protein